MLERNDRIATVNAVRSSECQRMRLRMEVRWRGR